MLPPLVKSLTWVFLALTLTSTGSFNCEILNLVDLALSVEIGSDERRLTDDGVLNQVLDSPPSVILIEDVKIILRDPFLGESHGLHKDMPIDLWICQASFLVCCTSQKGESLVRLL